MTTQQTFKEAVAEFLVRAKENLGKERMEGLPPAPPSPYDQSGPPFVSPLRLTERYIREYVWSIGDDNPLYTDPEYAKNTRYGAQLVPGPIMVKVRAGGGSGPSRPQGYPMGAFVAGTAWEFFNVMKVGSGPYRSAKTDAEVFEKPGTGGNNLIFLICDIPYSDSHGDVVAKAYGTLICVPLESMGNTRSMDVSRLGEKMMYTRGAAKYSEDDVKKYVNQIEKPQRRGAQTLYWEDVEIGDKLGPLVFPPWSLQDQIASTFSGHGEGESFEAAYHRLRKRPGGARTNPATMWPWTPGAEHEDAFLAAFRGQSGPFDHGVQRWQITHALLANWMGDDGFIRRWQMALRRPVYSSDVTSSRAEVVKKFTETQKGENKPGGAPGSVEYHAVGIRIEGTNQVGQSQTQGSATVYLPSRKAGPVHLPIPHAAKPPYVPYETFYRDWY